MCEGMRMGEQNPVVDKVIVRVIATAQLVMSLAGLLILPFALMYGGQPRGRVRSKAPCCIYFVVSVARSSYIPGAWLLEPWRLFGMLFWLGIFSLGYLLRGGQPL